MTIVQIGPTAWDVTMLSQAGSNQALRIGGAAVTQRFYGTKAQAIGQARLFMAQNGVGATSVS
jgi:hypothetical protein